MKTRLLVVVGMMISTTIFAQKNTRDSRKPEDNGYERMKRELALSENQYTSIKKIRSKYDKKSHEQRTAFDKRRSEERETMRSLRLEREREMHNVFTPTQSKKWDELRAIQKNKKHFRKGEGKRDDRAHKHFRNGRDRGDARHGLKRKG